MGVNDWSEAERQLFAIGSRAVLDDLERQAEEWNAGAALDTTSGDDAIREHNRRVREIEEQHKAWLARFLSGDDEGAPQDVQQASQGASSGRGPVTPAGVPAGLNPDPREAEMADRRRAQEMAAAVRDMDLADYAQLRAELHIGSGSARGLFG